MAGRPGGHKGPKQLPHLNTGQANQLATMGGMFSPALPTALQASFNPALQTPMQQHFNKGGFMPGHRAAQASLQLAAMGIVPPPMVNVTTPGPGQGHFPRHSIVSAANSPFPIPHTPVSNGPPFPGRNRRGLSIGGPPKAVLGGPQRNKSPNPAVAGTDANAPATPNNEEVSKDTPSITASAPPKKKVVVKLPQESTPTEEDGKPLVKKAEFARTPLPLVFVKHPKVAPVETNSSEDFKIDGWVGKKQLPPNIDIYLPGKAAWEHLKRQEMEEKLSKLGVEPVNPVPSILLQQPQQNSNSLPPTMAPHGRSASISSPADPALLLFKLNKLQQQQQASSTSSNLSTSSAASTSGPSPSISPLPLFFAPRPGLPPRLQGAGSGHGQSLSLASMPMGFGLERNTTPGGTALNPFGQGAVLGNDSFSFGGKNVGALPPRRSPLAIVTQAESVSMSTAQTQQNEQNPNLLAPIPKVPIGSASSNAPPLSAVRSSSAGSSKPDFILGFGLDIPEESEEEGLEEDEPQDDRWKSKLVHHGTDSEFEESGDMDEIELNSANSDKENDVEGDESGLLTARHSRHVSRLSAALSMRSFSGLIADGLKEVEEKEGKDDPLGLTESVPKDADGEMSVFGHRVPRPASIDTKGLQASVTDGAEEWSASVSDGVSDEDDDGDAGADAEAETESIGSFSNPSDEERARNQRAERRLHRRGGSLAMPLPDHPQNLMSRTMQYASASASRAVDDSTITSNNTIITNDEEADYPRSYDNYVAAYGEEQEQEHVPSEPRRIPNFPRPPDNTAMYPLPHQIRRMASDDIISNPSEEEEIMQSRAFLEPGLHSRVTSGQHSLHDPAYAHSRVPSTSETVQQGQRGMQGLQQQVLGHHHQRNFSGSEGTRSLLSGTGSTGGGAQGRHGRVPSLSAGGALNPHAKPFVFGVPQHASQPQPQPSVWDMQMQMPVPQPASANPTPAQLSAGKSLNVAAPEFKPGNFTFKALIPYPQQSTSQQAVVLGYPASNPTPDFSSPPVPMYAGAPRSNPLSVKAPDASEGGQAPVGREKRQRMDGGDEDEEAQMPLQTPHAMASFKFPPDPNNPRVGIQRRTSRAVPIVAPSNAKADDDDEETEVDKEDTVSERPVSATKLNPGALPFTFDGFNKQVTKMPSIPSFRGMPEPELANQAGEEDEDPLDEGPSGSSMTQAEFSYRANKPVRRAPIPLDFKLATTSSSSVSTVGQKNNTITAGAFKALVGDERTRRTVRSRLSTHDANIYSEHSLSHSLRPSLDDLDVEAISLASKASTSNNAGALSGRNSMRSYVDKEDNKENIADGVERPVGLGHGRRRSSLPDNLGLEFGKTPTTRSDEEDDEENEEIDESGSDMSEVSLLPSQQHPTGPVISARYLESILDRVLDSKFSAFRRDAVNASIIGGAAAATRQPVHTSLKPETEALINEAISLFRSQLTESTAKALDDSQMDGHGDLDFELVKDIIRDGQKELLHVLRSELEDMVPLSAMSRAHSGHTPNQASIDTSGLIPAIELHGNRTTRAVLEAMSDLSTKMDILTAVSQKSTPAGTEVVTNDLLATLKPILSQMRPEAVDYEYLTEQLSQAVKPHISQLIDLASDKRETAALIVERILPLLPQQKFDTTTVINQLTTEVRRAIAPIDAFEIKEQVADLVVERLDSRFAIRDKAFNLDTISARIASDIGRAIEPFEMLHKSLGEVADTQKSMQSEESKLVTIEELLTKISQDIPASILTAIEDLKKVQLQIAAAKENDVPLPVLPDENVLHIRAAVDALSGRHDTGTEQRNELLALQKDISERLGALPDAFATATAVLQAATTDANQAREAYKREMDDLRRANAELQVELSKARGAHGQIRVEKETLKEKVKVLEEERVSLRKEVKDLQTAAKNKFADFEVTEARNKELEEALAKALARLQTADVERVANQERIAELEKVNKDLTTEKQTLKSKTDSLDLQVTFANRDKENAEKTLAVLQRQHDQLTSQEKHWEDLRHTSQAIDMLTSLIGQVDNEEIKELRQVRDRSKVLEGEHAALQKRYRDLEAKHTSSEKTSATTRQNLTQAQSRASEWEKRAKEYEAELEFTKTKLEQAEQSHDQLETDYNLVKSQLEEREGDERLTKDREMKLRDQVHALETKAAHLQKELSRAVEQKQLKASASTFIPNGNGNAYSSAYSRPESRASTANGAGGDRTPPAAMGGLWESRHNPHNPANQQKYGSPVPYTPSPPQRYPTASARPTPPPSNARRVVHQGGYNRSSVVGPGGPPSPTPSTVSLAPTLGADGWWS